MTQEKDVKETIVEKRVSKRVIRRRVKKEIEPEQKSDKPDDGQLIAGEVDNIVDIEHNIEKSKSVEPQETKLKKIPQKVSEVEVEKIVQEKPVKEEKDAKEDIISEETKISKINLSEKPTVVIPQKTEDEAAFKATEKDKTYIKKTVFQPRQQATPDQIKRAVELSRAKTEARKSGKPLPSTNQTRQTFSKERPLRGNKIVRDFEKAPQKKKDIEVNIAATQVAATKLESGKFRKKLRKETLFVKKEEMEIEERYNKKFRKKRSGDEQKQTEITVPKAIKRVIKINEAVIISDLAKSMSVKSGDVIKKLINLGVVATLNQSIDLETAQIIASEFGFEIINEAFQEQQLIKTGVEDSSESMKARAPIVTVMGHVDHGKTTLLDTIRSTRVVDGEEGGITQHIGAYRVSKIINNKNYDIVFIDTPGHEAFTAMRARGARITDLVVLVVAADDGIMPQTIEAINHAKAANVPILVAVNKVDKPGANISKIKQTFTEFELVAEEWGGTTIFQEVSALKGTGVDQLLELIALQTDILELKANPNRNLEGVVVEGKLEKGRGPVATVIVKNGTVRVGDYIVCGVYSGRVRALINDTGQNLKEAGPSTPVEITGLNGVPKAGDTINSVDNEKICKEISEQRNRKARDEELMKSSKVSLEDLHKRIEEGDVKILNIVLKTDVHGTVDAILGGLEKLSTDKVKVKVIHGSVGAITETDVNLASASNAIILGFNIRPSKQVIELASFEKVSIKTYTIIYELLDEVKKAMEGLLAPTKVEKYHSRIQIRQTFHASKIGTIAGCYVLDGKVGRKDKIRILRDSVVIYEGKLASLKRFKDDVKEVQAGYECGLSIENFNDLKVNDELETFVIEEKATKL